MVKMFVQIAVSPATREKLMNLKIEMRARSIDEVISRLLEAYYKTAR